MSCGNIFIRIAAVLIFVLSHLTIADAQEKMALIIGNDRYVGKVFGSLSTCVNDADEMDMCLSALGYTNTVLRNATRQEMADAFKTFNKQVLANKAKVAVFFYSGHAVTVDNEMLLAPADTDIQEFSLKTDCIGVSEIKHALKQNCRYSFLFLDACRDFRESRVATKNGNWEASTNMSLGTINEQLICYATSQGKVAYEGSGRLSPFTKVLAPHLFDMNDFKKVWSTLIVYEVEAIANQQPVMESWFYSDFIFNENGVKSPYFKKSTMDKTHTESIAVVKPKDKVNVTFKVYPEAKIRFGDMQYDSGTTLTLQYGKSYAYAVVHEGYESVVDKIVVDENTPETVEIRLKKSYESRFAVISDKPKNVSVYLDDKYVGKTPCIVKTTSGKHALTFKADNFYTMHKSVDLHDGKNDAVTVSLTRNVPEYFEFNGMGAAHNINYHYSPNYQIGFSYYYSLEESPVSFGAMMAFSPRLFGNNFYESLVIQTSTNMEIKTQITIEDETGEARQATSVMRVLDDLINDEYSSTVDPYNEAQVHKANFLILGNVGFNPCNGFVLEFGGGAACLKNRYYMPNTYKVTTTTVIDNLTGEVIGEPVFEYTPRTNTPRWYNGKAVWTPALRFGGRIVVPLDGFYENSLTLGAGYIYLPKHQSQSSWDLTIGYTRYF